MRLLLSLIAMSVASSAMAQDKVKLVPVVKLERKTPVSFDKDVAPIFEKKCIVCHSGKELKGKLDLSSYEAFVKGGQRGPALIPGKGGESLVYKLMHREMKPFMPPKNEGEIAPEELALVKLWIDEGAKAPTGAREKRKIVVGVPPANVQPVRAVAIAGKTIAAGRGNHIHLYDAETGSHLRSLVAPDLKTAAGAKVDAAHLSIVEALAFSPDGKTLVSGSFQEVNVWDPEAGSLKKKIPGFAHNVVALAFSPDGKLLATAGGEPSVDGEVKVFATDSWKQVMDLKAGHSDTVYGVCFSPDGKLLATASSDKFIKIWEAPSGKFVKSFEGHTHHVLDIAWSGDGKLLASAGGDNTVKIWDFEKGEQARTIAAHTKQVTRLVFVGKKAELLTAGGDHLVKLLNPTNGGILKTFAGSNDFIYAIAADPDGKLLVAGGQDGIVRTYNPTTAAVVKTLTPPEAK